MTDDRPSTNGAGSSQIRNRDLLALRNFVTAQDNRVVEASNDVWANANRQDIISIDLTHSNLQQRHVEIRFSLLHDTLYTLRTKIHRQTGTPCCDQHLQLYNEHGDLMGEITCHQYIDHDDTIPLISLGFQNDGMQNRTRRPRVHCIDTNPHSTSAHGGLENVDLVEKFKLTDAQYRAKSNTLYQWKQEQLKNDPNFSYHQYRQDFEALQNAKHCHKQGLPLPEGFVYNTQSNQVERIKKSENGSNVQDDSEDKDHGLDDSYNQASVQHATIGHRCQVLPGKRRGTIRWIGEFQTRLTSNDDNGEEGQITSRPPSGWWIGIEFDEPVGQNDGSLHGVSYFETVGPKYGCFARGPNVEVGDFPVRDLWDESDEDKDDDEI